MNILYILSTYNINGGTPKKTLDLINGNKYNSFLYTYYENLPQYKKYKANFEKKCVKILESNHKFNIYRHINLLLNFIDKNSITIVQTQFFMGEMLGGILQFLRPKLKVIITFEGSSSPKGVKRIISNIVYKYINNYVYISKYVQKEKENIFNILKLKNSKVIYNGVSKRKNLHILKNDFNHTSLVDIASLSKLKNFDILIETMDILINHLHYKDIYLYLIGEGSYRESIEKKINKRLLGNHIKLLGVQDDIGGVLEQCDIFVHPCYMEGFGLSVVEAMIAKKPIIAANTGAHTELIQHNFSGLLVDPYNPREWVDSILMLKDDMQKSKSLAQAASKRANKKFSEEKYITQYMNLYSILKDQQ